MTAEHKRATPANWPENRIFADKVIVPPAANMAEMAKNMSTYECKDWYLCTQSNPNK
jgi:peroxiredoxin (alkyl hydroperoxide reductase subunit C)